MAHVLITHLGDPAVYFCSGAVIDRTTVLTAAHCFPPAKRIFISVNGSAAVVNRIDYVADLAVLITDTDGLTPIRLRRTSVPIGMPVAVVGYGFNAITPKYTFGHVSDITDFTVAPGLFIDVTMLPGQSGGLVVDRRGRLIAIAKATVSSSNASSHLGVATGLYSASRFLADLPL